jgi:hypothetical protein
MKKRAIVVLSALSLAAWLAGTGFSAVTVETGPETAPPAASRTQDQPHANPDYGQHGPWMMSGSNMPQGTYYGMMGGGMHGTMGPGNGDEGFSWRRMWNQCRQFWSGHDNAPGSGTTTGPRG